MKKTNYLVLPLLRTRSVMWTWNMYSGVKNIDLQASWREFDLSVLSKSHENQWLKSGGEVERFLLCLFYLNVYAVIISVCEEMLHVWRVALPWKWSIMSVMKGWIMLSHFPSGQLKVSKFTKSIPRKHWTDPRTFFSQLTIECFHWLKLFIHLFIYLNTQ